MVLSWDEIHDLEMKEEYPAVVDALESRLQENPAETEAVIRLGFNLWYAAAESARLGAMGRRIPAEQYVARFIRLYGEYRTALDLNADFCWVFGLGISLFPSFFDQLTKQLGNELMDKARTLDKFWEEFPHVDYRTRFKGRGLFASYYAGT